MKIRDYMIEAKKFKTMGDEVEDMEIHIEEKDTGKFDKILNKYIGHLDPDLSIKDAVNKLSKQKAQKLKNDLLNLHYGE